MRTPGKKITIYRVDGSDDGVQEVSIGNWNGKALAVSLPRYDDLKKHIDSKKPGVYLLIGPPMSRRGPQIYIGETDNLLARLDSHRKNKDFWDRVIIFVSKDEFLNKTHSQFLEARLIEMAKESGIATLKNAKTGHNARLSIGDKDVAEQFLSEMLVILSLLDVKVFKEKKVPTNIQDLPKKKVRTTQQTKFYLSGPNCKAEGVESTGNKFLVYKGARARAEPTKSISERESAIREALLDEGIFVRRGKHFLLTRNYEFSSSSLAASVIMGRHASGYREWRDSSRKNLGKHRESRGRT